MAQTNSKTALFETMPIPNAVAQLSIPVVVTSLVMVVYNLADTYFVGMLNNPIQNAAVTLVYPVMLAFNAVNNLFGVGTSSMMSRSLGAGDYERVKTSSAFGFYGALFSGLLFALICTLFRTPLLHLLGADANTMEATSQYMFWTVTCGAMPAIMRKIVLEIPLLFLLNNLFPLYGLAYAQCVTEIVLASAALVMLVRIFNQKPVSEPGLSG